MADGDIHVCVSWLSHTSTNATFFPKSSTDFLTCFSKSERRKYAEKNLRLNRVSNSQSPGHGSDLLTTEPSGRESNSIEKGSPVETEIVRVVSLSTREITEITRFKKSPSGSGYLNSLPNDKILDVTKLKAFATQMMISVFDRLKIIVGKGENADYQHFLLCPQCFQKDPSPWSLKAGILW